ncbi:carboxypeptidase-like regulatory domain-containing protein [Galbibacter sp. BG1]|uniref:carboxypeptidase-like regulatory domain-containing protein n=1 Tax=Galbibacter sp. BG1 TaxID=1170699 RepID=UPI0015BAFFAA|nr:carboxypeptidase-like regulatory domain-containing protein [Galbibacter sp. BG1]QLE01005.1 carboxypeptidase-like regulatory domain-containing protein [Galbibacter sp. BG1]
MKINSLVISFLILFCNHAFAQKEVAGKVLDAETKEVLPFVNIGIKETNNGTISMEDGSFSLEVPSGMEKNTVTFSCIGYQQKGVSVLKMGSNEIILLQKEIYKLEEVVVTDTFEQLKEEKLGSYRKSRYNTGESNTGGYGVGKEYGIKIASPGRNYVVKKVNFSLKFNTLDSVLFRINIYDISKTGWPTESILPRQLFVKTYKKQQLVTLDVSNLNLRLDQDVIVTLEPVRLWYDPKNDNQLFYAQAKGYRGETFLRKSSLSSWLKNELPPFAIYFDVAYLQ